MNALFHTFLVPSALLLLVSGCAKKEPEKVSHTWFGMDTRFTVVFYAAGKDASQTAIRQIMEETGRLEKMFSDYNPGSDISAATGREGDTITVGPEIYSLLQFSLDLAGKSSGAFNINLHKLKALWGLGTDETPRVPSDDEIRTAMSGASLDSIGVPILVSFLGNGGLVLRQNGIKFDLGAIVKGYTADRLSLLLDSLGHPDHLIIAGGEIRIRGSKHNAPWIIGIRNPRHPDPASVITRMGLSGDWAVSTSGDYERFFIQDSVRYHHIFDPRTGYPARGFCSVTILGHTGRITDALSTTLFVLGPQAGAPLLRHFGAEAMWIRDTENGLCAIATPGLFSKADMSNLPLCPGHDPL